jgi:nicotinamidase-related amidase
VSKRSRHNSSSSNLLITREQSVLIVIDMQERLVPAMSDADKVVRNIRKLLAFARIIGLPVIITEQEKLGTTIPDLKHEIQDSTPLSKVCFNCLLSDSFSAEVERLNRDTFILTGVEAHICVAQTALAAIASFNVHVVADAISSRAPDNCNLAVERMRASGVTITSTEMVIYELFRQAGTDEFKATLPLIK